MNAPLLELECITLQVGTRTLVRDLSLRLMAGEIWCLLGPNGAGKTTLLHTVLGLHKLQGGSIRLAGRALDEWPLPEAARMRGFMPQAQYDVFGASVLDTVLLGRHPYLTRWQWEDERDRDIARAALAAVELAGFEGRDVLTLSGGERQRVALAALLVLDAPLFLLDEPVSHLDLHHQALVLNYLHRLALERKKTVLFTVHDLNLAARYATHALILGPQGASFAGPIEDVMVEPELERAFNHHVSRIKAAGRTLFLLE